MTIFEQLSRPTSVQAQAQVGAGAGAGDDAGAGASPGALPPDAEVINAGTGVTSGDNRSLALPSLQIAAMHAEGQPDLSCVVVRNVCGRYRGRVEVVVTEVEIADIDACGVVVEIASKMAFGIVTVAGLELKTSVGFR